MIWLEHNPQAPPTPNIPFIYIVWLATHPIECHPETSLRDRCSDRCLAIFQMSQGMAGYPPEGTNHISPTIAGHF